MDFLDILQGRYNQTQTGMFYKNIPENTPAEDGVARDAAIPFDYEYIDVESRAYKQLISNLTDETAGTTAIKTKEALQWQRGRYVVLMDGGLYRIVGVDTDRTKARREALALFPYPINNEYILRLVEIDNPRGIR